MKILLACNGGISTGLIADKMSALAKKDGKEYKIWAIDDSQIESELTREDINIVLLGPQIKFKLKTLQSSLSRFNVPIVCMNSIDYGMNDASKILSFAENFLKEEK